MNKRNVIVKMLSFVALATAGLVVPVFGADDVVPIIWYKMDAVVESDGQRTIEDATGNGHTLTLGSGCYLTNGLAGPALWYDGTSNAFGRVSGVALSSRTISFLFWREVENGPIYQSELYEYGAKTTWPYVFEGLSGQRCHLDTSKGSSSATYYLDGVKSWSRNGVATRGKWQHIVYVYEQQPMEDDSGSFSGSLSIYVDGVLLEAKSFDSLTDTSWASTIILGNSSTKLRPIFGALDEVRVYDTALTAEEVTREALRVYKDSTPRLMAHWRMDKIEETDAGEQRVVEASGNGSDLVLGTGCSLVDDGVVGKGLRFDGSLAAYALVENVSANFTQIADWTFSGWVRQHLDSRSVFEVGHTNLYPRIFEGSDALFHFNNPQGFGYTYKGIGCSDNNGVGVPGRPAILDAWVHYTVVNRVSYDAEQGALVSTPTFYINGKREGNGKTVTLRNNKIFQSMSTLIIGNSGKNGARAFHGDFADFRFYSGALSDEEVKAVYNGIPSVSAGGDFTTTSDTATLQGQIGTVAERAGFNVASTWTLVSAPDGGAAATIEQPGRAVTRVTLPVEGDYVFRLTVGNFGDSASDEVTITRAAEAAGNQPPTVTIAESEAVTLPAPLMLSATVTDADTALERVQTTWEKVSGPGGVWFTTCTAAETRAAFSAPGAYVLRFTANDGVNVTTKEMTVTVSGETSSLSLTNGLVRYYPMNEKAYNQEMVSGSTAMMFMHTSDAAREGRSFPYRAGVTGYGLRMYNAKAYASSGLSLPETGTEGEVPTDPRYLAFSLWMYHDTSDTNVCKYASLFNVCYTLGFFYSPGSETPFQIFQQTKYGSAMSLDYPAPTVSPQNRWTHVYVLYDRTTGRDFALYVDGVELTTASTVQKFPGRIKATERIQIGGMAETTGGPQGPQIDEVTGVRYSRVFPGVIDEFRVYNRKLTEAEIKALAVRPSAIDYAPIVEVPSVLKGRQNGTAALSATIHDYGEVDTTERTYRWRVVSGNADGLDFEDATNPSTTLTFEEVGIYGIQLEINEGGRTIYSNIISVDVVASGTCIIIR